MLSSRKASMLEFFMWKTFFFFACQRRRFRQETVIIECWTLITGLLFFLIFRNLEEVLRIQESENYSDTKAYFFDGRLVFDTFDDMKLEFFVA